MALVKLTFDGANNTAKHDAVLNAFITNYENGIIDGLGGNLDYSVSNGVVTFQDGYVCVYGRIIYVEPNTSVTINLDATKNGYIVIDVNTQSNTVQLFKVEQTSGYPSLTQNNLLLTNGSYHLPILAYSKTTTSLTINNSFERPFIKTNKNNLSSFQSEVPKSLRSKYFYYSTKVSNTYTFDLSSINIDESLIIIPIHNDFITVPGRILGSSSGSVAGYNYTYLGSIYTMSVKKENSKAIITTGATNHTLSSIYAFY